MSMNTETMKQAASIAELKSAYRKLAFENHPDRGGSEEAMKEINSVFTACFDRLKGKVVTKADSEDFGTAKTAREYTDFVYNEYRWEGSRYDRSLSLSEICKKIKDYAAKRFPTCKFSVRKDGYRSIDISLMSGDFNAYATDKDRELNYRSYNHYHSDINTEFSSRCNEVLRLVSEYAESYNYDNSDIMTDYFDVNFYLNVSVGKFNKAYVNTSTVINGEKIAKTETEKSVQKALGTNNWVFKTTVAKVEDYFICERGDNPYAHYYSQYSLVQAKLDKLNAAGIKAESFRHAIRITNWEEIAKQIESERAAMVTKSETKPEVKSEPAQEVKCGEVRIIDYSERAIAVIGDTKPIKGLLKSAGGSFNSKLSCGCGWVFSKKRRSEVEQIVKNASK